MKSQSLFVIACLIAAFTASSADELTKPDKDLPTGTAVLPGVPLSGGRIRHDVVNRTVEMSDSEGRLKMRLNYAGRCFLDQVQVNGREIVSGSTGVCTGIQVGGQWVTTRTAVGTPVVKVDGDDILITHIDFSSGEVSVRESWRFRVLPKEIEWRIDRQYLSTGTVDDSYFPGWDFATMTTWTAGLLDTGGVAWCRYLGNGASFGTHAGSVSFWKGNDGLKVTAMPSESTHLASRFSHQPSGIFTFAQSVNTQPLLTKHDLRRSISGMDVWAPFEATSETAQTLLRIEATNADAMRYRGTFEGLDGRAVGDLLDTIGRYGVIDRRVMGGNGWLTGWVCLHEPFFAQMGLAIGDADYTANLATSLDAWRDHALQPGGRVYSRWHHDTSDNMVAGSYDPLTGYYECGWGDLLDSQTDYAINVAEQFDLTGDRNWLLGQKEPCERALEWLLNRDSDHDGLVEMTTDSHARKKSSDWLDVVWASWENAFVNAKLYNALTLWSEREEILGDAVKAGRYRRAASQLRESFIRPVSQGGFWDPDQGWFAYWRDKDGSVHGNNFVTAVNFAAVAYGLCTEQQRQLILDGMETRMRQENLFHWPSCFLPYAPEEGKAGANFPDYENGDIFLSWGGLGIRAYANYHPATAVAYVNRVLDRYRLDGLSFQRYRRASQAGAGDDILAGNSMTIVGLYRDIYGVRPQWNRLMLDPHLTPELAGTRLSYRLRNHTYELTLNPAGSAGSVRNFTVKATTPFAFNATSDKVAWFSGVSEKPSLEIARQPSADVTIEVVEWSATGPCRWVEAAAAPTLEHMVHGLVPDMPYRLAIAGVPIRTLIADANGTVTFTPNGDASTPRAFALEPVAAPQITGQKNSSADASD